jgi:hypothetical protein
MPRPRAGCVRLRTRSKRGCWPPPARDDRAGRAGQRSASGRGRRRATSCLRAIEILEFAWMRNER